LLQDYRPLLWNSCQLIAAISKILKTAMNTFLAVAYLVHNIANKVAGPWRSQARRSYLRLERAISEIKSADEFTRKAG
jgi:hypothetical protein